MLDSGWQRDIFDFYTFDGAKKLRDHLAAWKGGKLVVHVNEMPIKCPVAPLEFCFLADWHFQKRGMRSDVEITYVTPLSGAFTKPEASRTLGHLLKDKGIHLVTDFSAERIDSDQRKLICYDGREVPDVATVVADYGEGDANASAYDSRNFTIRGTTAPLEVIS